MRLVSFCVIMICVRTQAEDKKQNKDCYFVNEIGIRYI